MHAVTAIVSSYVQPPAAYKKHVLRSHQQLRLLQSFSPFSVISPQPWEEGMCSGMTCRNEHSRVSYFLLVDQLLVSVLITIHFQKFL